MFGDGRGDEIGIAVVEVHAPARVVALEAVTDVEVLCEVPSQGEVQEGALGRGEFHSGRETALDNGEIAHRQVTIEAVDVAANFQARLTRKGGRINARSGDHDHTQ